MRHLTVLFVSLAACVGTKGDTSSTDSGSTCVAPVVLFGLPADHAANVTRNADISATFSESMDAASLGPLTFRVTSGDPAVAVPGAVALTASTAHFRPTDGELAPNATYTVTVTTGAKSACGLPLAADDTWTFSTGESVTFGVPVDLGTAANYVILAKTGVSNVPTSAVTGDIGVSPAAETYLTGFSLTADATNVFSTSTQVTGRLYAADDAVPTPSNLTTAVTDMQTAFTSAAGRPADVTELGAGAIGGMTLPAGVYGWGTSLSVPTDLTLDGTATDVWVFEIAGDLTVASGVAIHLTGGAVPQNVFWQVSGRVDIGTTAHLEGVVLSQTSVTLATGASSHGRLLAQTAVSIDGSTVVAP